MRTPFLLYSEDRKLPHAECDTCSGGATPFGWNLKGSVEKNLKEHAYRRFYMHKTGHWLGLDVHDVGDYRIDGEFRELEPGMVVTVEPGIYIAPDAKGVPAKWRGIGIRIEDDVVITRGEPEVLTAGVPNDADEIEALMATTKANARER